MTAPDDPRALGWAPLWRCIRDSDHWLQATLAAKAVMIAVILRLRHRDSGKELAGTATCSADLLGRDCGISAKAARDGLRQLEESGWCRVERRSKGIVVVVDGWRRWLPGGAVNQPECTQVPITESGSPVRDCTTVPITEPGDCTAVPITASPYHCPDLREEDLREEDQTQITLRVIAPEYRSQGPTTDYARAIDAFDRRFQTAYCRKPTWGGRQGKAIKRLLSAHGLDRVLVAIEVLFTSPPRYLSPPYDVGTLETHFDKLIPLGPSAPGRRGLTTQEIFNLAREEDTRGGAH